MSVREGFLVVEKKPGDGVARNARYAGLDRLPPWSQQRHEAGFDDPYVFGSYTNDAGLIQTYGDALRLKKEYEGWLPLEELEVIHARTTDGNGSEGSAQVSGVLLGFDVAADAPFYSIVGDPPINHALEPYLSQLNEHGLFSSGETARGFLRQYLERRGREREGKYYIWEVRRV